MLLDKMKYLFDKYKEPWNKNYDKLNYRQLKEILGENINYRQERQIKYIIEKTKYFLE